MKITAAQLTAGAACQGQVGVRSRAESFGIVRRDQQNAHKVSPAGMTGATYSQPDRIVHAAARRQTCRRASSAAPVVPLWGVGVKERYRVLIVAAIVKRSAPQYATGN